MIEFTDQKVGASWNDVVRALTWVNGEFPQHCTGLLISTRSMGGRYWELADGAAPKFHADPDPFAGGAGWYEFGADDLEQVEIESATSGSRLLAWRCPEGNGWFIDLFSPWTDEGTPIETGYYRAFYTI